MGQGGEGHLRFPKLVLTTLSTSCIGGLTELPLGAEVGMESPILLGPQLKSRYKESDPATFVNILPHLREGDKQPSRSQQTSGIFFNWEHEAKLSASSVGGNVGGGALNSNSFS